MKTILIVGGAILLAGVVFLVVKTATNRNPPVSGAAAGPAAGPAPNGAGRTGSKVTNTINDILSFTKQGVDIANAWNSGKKAMG